ncbi:MAG: YHS domain-containing protein, partial [Armatimonadota bacterium]
MTKWLIVGTIALTFALAPWATAQTKATNAKGNKSVLTCPVSGETIANPSKALRYAYKGKTYYFCSRNCLNRFKASPAAYLNRKPAKASNAVQASSKACCSDKAASGCVGEKGAAGKSCCSDKAAGCCANEKGTQTASKGCCSDKPKTVASNSGNQAKGEKAEATDQQAAQNAKL